MRTVLPGWPQAKLQAVHTAQWDDKRLIAYTSGTALVILGGPQDLIQTIYHDECATLAAVAVDDSTGKIAVSSPGEVRIYRPYGRDEGALRWSLESLMHVTEGVDVEPTVSWGTDAELLVGASSLKLYLSRAENRLIWDRSLAKPVKYASFSNDASLIASTGFHDRLIKLWRRQSFGADDTRFDFAYLPHPTTVTDIHWRRSKIHEHHVDNVLFSVCADSKIRIWAATEPHSVHALQLWAEINMIESIQPRIVDPPLSQERYVFFIDSGDVTAAAQVAERSKRGIVANDSGNEHHASEHLHEVAKTAPEICVVIDKHGNMSAWGIENIGHEARKPTDIFNVAHVENIEISFLHGSTSSDNHAHFFTFTMQQSGNAFVILTHHFDGRITWSDCRLEQLLDPSAKEDRLSTRAVWTGHTKAIKKIVRNHKGRALFSRTSDNQGLIWKHGESGGLIRTSNLQSSLRIRRALLLRHGDYVAVLHNDRISLWDARSLFARETAYCQFHVRGQPRCLVRLPRAGDSTHIMYLAIITSEMESVVWAVTLPVESSLERVDRIPREAGIQQFCTASLGHEHNSAFVLPIDPAGSSVLMSGFLDSFAQDVVISYTDEGLLHAWTATVDASEGTVQWLRTSTIESGILTPSLATENTLRKTALVDQSRNRLTIWDQRSGELEYDKTFEPYETIQDLNWSATPDNQSILAVGFPFKVVLFAQLRFDYLDTRPAWAPIREISIKELTSYPIGDSVWLERGHLVIGTGNQLYIYDQDTDTANGMIAKLPVAPLQHATVKIFDLVSFLNSVLPIFHPQFLSQCFLAGSFGLVEGVILALDKALKYFVPGDELSSLLSIPPESLYIGKEDHLDMAKDGLKSPEADSAHEEGLQSVTGDLAVELKDALSKLRLPHLSSIDQMRLVGLIETFAVVEKQRRSLDDPALRFLILLHEYVLRNDEGSSIRVDISWREIVSAYHSESQDILIDLVSKQLRGRMLWIHARETGMFMWMTDAIALRAQFEVVARNEYTKTDEKNPIDCSLYYLALKKKNVLLGLWRMAAWNREQASTLRLLKNDFSETRWKTAALKNAYALLSKRRFEYAAAFFLLADHLLDAVNVCANQMQDLQLAVTIARVYDGDDSSVLRRLLEDKVLPQAAEEGNRWMASWAFWMLNQQAMAVRVLLSPAYTNMIDSTKPASLQAKSYRCSDPALIVLYRLLRDKIRPRQLLRGPAAISPREEWGFVMRTARLYQRMGCDWLALDLVRNWRFMQPLNEGVSANGHLLRPQEPTAESGGSSNSGSVHGGDDDHEEASLKSNVQEKEKEKEKKPPPPTMFEEPAASSLLDSFGF